MSFKVLLISAFTLLCAISASYSQVSHKVDSSGIKKILPDYVKLQFAGGIGFLSSGIGYTFFDHKLDVSFFYGYVPKYFTADDLHSISLQLTAKLFRFKVFKNTEILPLNIGWFAHHTFGNEFWVTLPDNYPDDYYWWSPGRNAGVFIGGEIKTKLLAHKTPASGTAFYARIGTRGLYLASKFENSSIPISDIIELGFGVAVYR
ncbi:MAG: hypothetical protein PF485_03675 [Bacteroidales bacterium]|jgi:hypothetical protein|nr:hypothetical protein [Bacteroidales bacterium]